MAGKPGKKTPAKTDPERDPIDQELALLRALERSERNINRLVEAKADDVAEHNEGIKAAQEDRTAILKTIADFRNGIRALPLE